MSSASLQTASHNSHHTRATTSAKGTERYASSPLLSQTTPTLVFWFINSSSLFSESNIQQLYDLLEPPLHCFRTYFQNASLLPQNSDFNASTFSGLDLLLYHSRDAFFCDVLMLSLKVLFQYGSCRVVLCGDLELETLANRLRKENIHVNLLSSRELEKLTLNQRPGKESKLHHHSSNGHLKPQDTFNQSRTWFSPQFIKVSPSHGTHSPNATLSSGNATRLSNLTSSAHTLKKSAVGQIATTSTKQEPSNPQSDSTMSPVTTFEPVSPVKSPSVIVEVSSEALRTTFDNHSTTDKVHQEDVESDMTSQHSTADSENEVSMNWHEWNSANRNANVEKLKVMMSGKDMMLLNDLLTFFQDVYEVPESVCQNILRPLLLSRKDAFRVDEASGEVFISLRQPHDDEYTEEPSSQTINMDTFAIEETKTEDDEDILRSQQQRKHTEEKISQFKAMFASFQEDAQESTTPKRIRKQEEPSDLKQTPNPPAEPSTAMDESMLLFDELTQTTPQKSRVDNSQQDLFPTPKLRTLQREDLPLIEQILQREGEIELEDLKEELESQGVSAVNLELFLIPYSHLFSVQQTMTSCIVSLQSKS